MILAICVPLLFAAAVPIGVSFSSHRSDAFEQVERYLTSEAARCAATLDGQFDRMAQIARSAAAYAGARPDMTQEELFDLLRLNIMQDPLVYGSCIAFEPGRFDPQIRLFSPYVCRERDGLRTIQLADAYDYTQPPWEWYRTPSATGSALWTEPYFDEGAGDIAMCTFSTPFFGADGAFRGVVTVDIPLKDLQHSVGPMMTDGGRFVILSRAGAFVSHPDPSFIMSATIDSLAERFNDPRIAELGRTMREGGAGVARLSGIVSSEATFVVHAPIPSAGWSFVAMIPEAVIMAPVYSALRREALFALGAVMLLLLIVLVVSVWITVPIQRLAGAVRELGAGNLEANARPVRSNDEIGDLARGFDAMVVQLKEHVDALTKETAAREAVESEMRVARAIQTSLLPRSFPPFPDRSEFSLHAVNVPARHVAGDFYDFFFVDPHTLVIVMADVSGKGVPAALFMAVSRTIIRNLATSGLAPAQVLERANLVLLESNDNGLFVTIFIAAYDTRDGSLRYANGGHPPPYRLRPGAPVTTIGGSTGTIVGVLPDQSYEECVDRLEPGDAMVLYTDGFPEARDVGGQFFGDARFQQTLAGLADQPVDELCRRAAERIELFQQSDLHDDVTMLALRRSPIA